MRYVNKCKPEGPVQSFFDNYMTRKYLFKFKMKFSLVFIKFTMKFQFYTEIILYLLNALKTELMSI